MELNLNGFFDEVKKMIRNYKLVGHDPVPVNDVLEWAFWFENAKEECKVAFDTVGDADISTVFLGLDHNYFGGVPILFETMIFGGEYDQYQERYHTWDEAEAGHKRNVEMVRTHRTPEEVHIEAERIRNLIITDN